MQSSLVVALIRKLMDPTLAFLSLPQAAYKPFIKSRTWACKKILRRRKTHEHIDNTPVCCQ